MAVKRDRPVIYYYVNPKYMRLKPLTSLSPFLVIELRNLIYHERKTRPKNKLINIKFNFRFGAGFAPLGLVEITHDFFRLYSIDERNNQYPISIFTGSDLIHEYKEIQSIT